MARGTNHLVAGTHPVKAVKELNTQTDEDKLIAYFNDPDLDASFKLSKKLEKLVARYEYARDQLNLKGSLNKCIPILAKKEWPDGMISRRTALRDLHMAQRIFGAGLVHDRKYHVDVFLGDLKQDITLARAKGDIKSLAALRKIQLEIISTHMGDSEAELYKQLIVPEITMVFDPSMLNTEMPESDEELQAQLEALRKPRFTQNLQADDVSFNSSNE